MEPRKLVLVDHNEFSQSVPGIEHCLVTEVVDHHRVSGFQTAFPVRMRCQPVGSTCTIVAQMYREQGVPVPQNLALLMAGAILSDTLALSSPTVTAVDLETVQFLAQTAGVDADVLAREMFSVSTDLSGLSLKECLEQDMKEFVLVDGLCRIAQVLV